MNRRVDIKPLRRFFLGVLAWPPETLMRARLEDLKDALDGYAEAHGLLRHPVSKAFLEQMIRQFPDKERET